VKRTLAVFLTIFVAINLSRAEEATFHGVKLADAKGKQPHASLTLDDSGKSVVVRVAAQDLATIPYDHLDRFTYEYTKKHRITQGAIVMVASIGVGAIVMLTRSRSHRLEIDYNEQGIPKSLVLRMDKREYMGILDAVKAHTGKEVEIPGNANKSKKG
jgi:hypothetical protein